MNMLVEELAAQKKEDKDAKPAWPVTQDSPFPDGYDIEAERVNLKDMLESDDPDPLDVRWSRLAELEQRERRCSRCIRAIACAPRRTRWCRTIRRWPWRASAS